MYGTPEPDLGKICDWARVLSCVMLSCITLTDNCDDGEFHLPCEDEFWYGQTCDRHENEILHVEHIPQASDCQSLCQNHPECGFWSHTSRHEGECWLHWQCDILTTHDCEEGCVAGPQWPDMDDCSEEP